MSNTTFKKKTGRYDKNSDWDETHVVFLNAGFSTAVMEDVEHLRVADQIDLTNEQYSESVVMWVTVHESEHSLQEDIDYDEPDYDAATKTYKPNPSHPKKWADRKMEQDSQQKSKEVIRQLWEYYLKHPELTKKPDK